MSDAPTLSDIQKQLSIFRQGGSFGILGAELIVDQYVSHVEWLLKQRDAAFRSRDDAWRSRDEAVEECTKAVDARDAIAKQLAIVSENFVREFNRAARYGRERDELIIAIQDSTSSIFLLLKRIHDSDAEAAKSAGDSNGPA